MKIVCLSDTHRPLNDLEWPPGDVLIHAGDLTMMGTDLELTLALGWLSSAPYEKKFFVWGNHDLETEHHPLIWRQKARQLGLSCLEPFEIHTYMGVNFVGSPFSSKIWGAYQLERGEKARQHWSFIPKETHVLVTHGPPAGVMDRVVDGEEVGDKDLRDRLSDLPELRLHVFGHIHEARGTAQMGGLRLVNASTLDENYKVARPPIVIELEV